ncbi:MAG: DUF167 domain-containing protein [Nanoarchaeota archaeon]
MILKIKVKPNSENQSIIKISDTEYKIHLKSFPEDNKANIELLKLLKKYFKEKYENINVIKGLKSKDKIVEIKN